MPTCRGATSTPPRTDIDKVIAADRPDAASAMSVTLSGQVETMRESYTGLFSGMALAVVLVYLLLVINFQSWLDPLIVLLAVPFALGGVMWMLFLTQTHISVPALMGTLMCIGLTTANSILVVTFANQRMERAMIAAAGRGRGRLHAPAPRADDRRRDDPRHDPDGAGRRRRRRAECAAGPRRHRRPAVRHLRDAGLRPDHVRPAAARATRIAREREPIQCNSVIQRIP